MESIKEGLNKFYTKIPGSYWAIIGGMFGFATFLIAANLYGMTTPYSFFTNPVSMLGWGPNGAEPVFRIGIIVLGCLLAPYIVFLTRFLWVKSGETQARKRNIINLLAIFSSLIAVIGLFIVSIFGNLYLNDLFYFHLIGATLFFLFAMIFILLYGISMHLSKKWKKIQVIGTLISIACSISVIASIIPMLSQYGLDFLFMFMNTTAPERVILMQQFLEIAPLFAFTEWLAVLSTCGWFVMMGFCTLKLEREQK